MEASINIKLDKETDPEKKLIHIDKDIAEMIPLIWSVLDDASDKSEEIPIMEITRITFDWVIEFLDHVKSGETLPPIEKPMNKKFTEYISESTWFFKFLPKERDDYLDLLKAANYLNV